jgi:hypothetical protein
MCGRVNPVELRVVSAQISLGLEVAHRLRDELMVALRAHERCFRFASGHRGKAQSGEGSLEHRVRAGLTEPIPQTGEPGVGEADKSCIREEVTAVDPIGKNGLGEVIAQFGVRRRQQTTEFFGH